MSYNPNKKIAQIVMVPTGTYQLNPDHILKRKQD